jgi:serine/threonine-protein kinase ULK4
MDKYHIYEEIGKGRYSQVFKGREKSKIEYVAIKRVDKSLMNNIVNEVQMIHRLRSPHIMKFHDWYETRNNLWLILEYCTGADLEALLAQDHHLPTQSVRVFGSDILEGLQYLHSKGILHCDVRPASFLVDEYGILKFADFKQARKVPTAPVVRGNPLRLQDLRNSCPEYMAPELLDSEVRPFMETSYLHNPQLSLSLSHTHTPYFLPPYLNYYETNMQCNAMLRSCIRLARISGVLAVCCTSYVGASILSKSTYPWAVKGTRLSCSTS